MGNVLAAAVGNRRRPRYVRRRYDPFEELPDHQFFERYRFPKQHARILLDEIREDLEYVSERCIYILIE